MHPHEEIIRDAPLLTRLADDDLRALVKSGREISFRKGETIFRQDDPGDALYVVFEGSVQITFGSVDGREITLAILGPGECFGDLALLDGRPRSAGAVAANAARTFVIARDAFVRWLDERPAAARSLLETLSLRLRQKDESLSDFSLLDLSHRLAKRLADLAAIDPAGKARGTGGIGVAVTQSEIAALLGVSRQSVNKELKKFESRGWITLSRGAVSVRDAPALRRYWMGEA